MYECKIEFIDDNDKTHEYDSIISEEEYNDLTSQQQRKFKYVGNLALAE